ncbi:MAG TPA: MerC domain-containing protein [Pyrinomonadaceae bacterium]|nr:MerC domain-containing protein [Pyrinomonadaceae bacterium]
MRSVNLRCNLAIFPALAAAAMPKCPLCLATISSTIGIGVVIETGWLLPLMLAFLAVSTGTLAFRARRRRGYNPFFLGITGAAFVLGGKFYFDNTTLVYLGAVLLAGATIWNSFPKKEIENESQPCCC